MSDPRLPADDFEKEAESLRNSLKFQRFLDERSRSTVHIPLDEVEAEVGRELQAGEALRRTRPEG